MHQMYSTWVMKAGKERQHHAQTPQRGEEKSASTMKPLHVECASLALSNQGSFGISESVAWFALRDSSWKEFAIRKIKKEIDS